MVEEEQLPQPSTRRASPRGTAAQPAPSLGGGRSVAPRPTNRRRGSDIREAQRAERLTRAATRTASGGATRTRAANRRASSGTGARRARDEERARRFEGIRRVPGRYRTLRERQQSVTPAEYTRIYGNALSGNSGRSIVPADTANTYARQPTAPYFTSANNRVENGLKGGLRTSGKGRDYALAGFNEEGFYEGNRGTGNGAYVELAHPITAQALSVLAGGVTPEQIARFLAATGEWDDTHLLSFLNLPDVGLLLRNGRVSKASTRATPPSTDMAMKVGFAMGPNGKLLPTVSLAAIIAANGNLDAVTALAQQENARAADRNAPGLDLGTDLTDAQIDQILDDIHENLSRPGEVDLVGLREAVAATSTLCPGRANLREDIEDIEDFLTTLTGQEVAAVIRSLGYQHVLPGVANTKNARYAGGSVAPQSVGPNTQVRQIVETYLRQDYPNETVSQRRIRNTHRILTTLGWILVSNCTALPAIRQALAAQANAKWRNWEARNYRGGAGGNTRQRQVPVGTNK